MPIRIECPRLFRPKKVIGTKSSPWRANRCRLTVSTCLLFAALAPLASSQDGFPPKRVTLPIEVTGDGGSVESVTVGIEAGNATQVRSLWLNLHGLEYPGMVGVQVNRSEWFTLNNQTASVAEPARSYGGIGGGISTLKLTLPLPENTVAGGPNTIRFRFNGTNGVASGFRVLSFNLLRADGSAILPPDAFRDEDPKTWTAPLPDQADISAGRQLWQEGRLVKSGLPGAPPIRAACSDCHTKDGQDLKYFNYSNASIVARSRFHGLSEWQGLQIASYVRSLRFPNPGRPWNPPYQPGPGVDGRPVANWAAGAGAAWVLDRDTDTLPFIFGNPGPVGTSTGPMVVRAEAFNPDANLNQREIPIALPLPDWNHWLPRVHPADAWGPDFAKSAFAELYGTADYATLAATGEMRTFFDKWSRARREFFTAREPAKAKWSPELGEKIYAAELWQLVKTWEITQDYNLEGRGASGSGSEARIWRNTAAADTAPAAANIPNGTSGMGGSALTNEYFNNAWYELQIVVNSGTHGRHGKWPVDWVYLAGRFHDLERLSGRPEPGRLLVALIKALQSSDPNTGPESATEGWRPDRNLDPRIIVGKDWESTFAPLPPGLKREIAESLLKAWLDKTLSYPASSYFQLGTLASGYERPATLRDVAGGHAWEAVAKFEAAGVNAELIRRLQEWGRQYMNLAELFHY